MSTRANQYYYTYEYWIWWFMSATNDALHTQQCIWQAPVDFFLYGAIDNCAVGLAYIDGCVWRIVKIRSLDFGSPQIRTRIYIVMIRVDCGSEYTLSVLCHIVFTRLMNCHKPCSPDELIDFATSRNIPALDAPVLRLSEAQLAHCNLSNIDTSTSPAVASGSSSSIHHIIRS